MTGEKSPSMSEGFLFFLRRWLVRGETDREMRGRLNRKARQKQVKKPKRKKKLKEGIVGKTSEEWEW